MAEDALSVGTQLPMEIVFWEILTRLPAKPLLRCRAVCRSWRHRLTSDTDFLLAHHRCQPAHQVVSTKDAAECRLDALDLRAGERRPLARTGRADTPEGIHVLAACDGLLIVYAYGAFHICNPTTRQCASLPLLKGYHVSGLYPDRPSGSYRVLCWQWSGLPNDAVDAMYYVHTVGSGELRCVGKPPEQWAIRDFTHPHVLVHGSFHWHPVKLRGGKCNNMLVFDTVFESFRRVVTPVEGPNLDSFELKGELGLHSYNFASKTADLWVLEDYDNNVWSFKHRIKLQRPVISFLIPDAKGDLFVTSMKKGSVDIMSLCLEHLSGTDGSALARLEWNDDLYLQRARSKKALSGMPSS